MATTKDNTCGKCAFGYFAPSEEDGATQWQGVCLAHCDLKKSDEELKREGKRTFTHTVMQHFHCSNGNFKSK